MTLNTANFSSSTHLLEEEMLINGKWEIQNFIAKGGKGEVYLAKQLNLDRQVALKIMSNEFIESLEGDEEEIISETMRFHREVQIMARMQHPNILQVFDFDQLEINGMKLDYIVMEYIPGLTLRGTMPEKGYGHDETKVKAWLKKYFFPILDGMKAVHDKGVVHRDMKPENVLVDGDLPKIMDFGISGGHHLDNVTQSHHMLGTMTYMPEEQFVDLALTDVRVDVYALGKILYEVVEGKMKKTRDKPFKSSALNQPKNSFFKTLDGIIQQATAKNRNQRTPSVKDLYACLEGLVIDSDEEKNVPAGFSQKYWKYLFGISVAVIVIFAGGILLHHDSEKTMSDGNQIQTQDKEASPATDFSGLPEFKFTSPQPTTAPAMDEKGKLPAQFLASDNMTMILLPGAEVTMALDNPMASETEKIQKTMLVKSLYMDRSKITNYLYVQFLNEADSIEVKRKSVLWKGRLLLLLGEVREGYEPILFKQGIFRVKPDAVAKPVVRVTPVGAVAYARFYGRTLPLMEQWWLSVQTGHVEASPEEGVSSLQSQGGGWNGMWMMENQNIQSKLLDKPVDSDIQSVTHAKANGVGILGLEQNVNEWTMAFDPDGTPEFHIHGGIGELDHKESYLERQLWEAFSDVGFRTVLNLDGEK